MNTILDFMFLSIPEGILFSYLIKVLIGKTDNKNIVIAGLINAVGLETIRLIMGNNDLVFILLPQILLMTLVFIPYYKLRFIDSFISVSILSIVAITVQVILAIGLKISPISSSFLNNRLLSYILLIAEFILYLPAAYIFKRNLKIQCKGSSWKEQYYLILIQMILFVIMFSINYKTIAFVNEIGTHTLYLNLILTAICIIVSIYSSICTAEAISISNFENVLIGIGESKK